VVLAMLLKVEECDNGPLRDVQEPLQLVVQIDVALVVTELEVVLLDLLGEELGHLCARQPGVRRNAQEAAQLC
jgi:hypothetical protein